jgi:hypothetical protein
VGFVFWIVGIRRYGWEPLFKISRDKSRVYVLLGMLILSASLMHLLAVGPDARYLIPWVASWISFNFIEADMALDLWGRMPAQGNP